MQAAEICKQHSEIEMGEQQSEIEKRTSTRDLNIWLWGLPVISICFISEIKMRHLRRVDRFKRYGLYTDLSVMGVVRVGVANFFCLSGRGKLFFWSIDRY